MVLSFVVLNQRKLERQHQGLQAHQESKDKEKISIQMGLAKEESPGMMGWSSKLNESGLGEKQASVHELLEYEGRHNFISKLRSVQ